VNARSSLVSEATSEDSLEILQGPRPAFGVLSHAEA